MTAVWPAPAACAGLHDLHDQLVTLDALIESNRHRLDRLGRGTLTKHATLTAQARRICRTCPVRDLCLEQAVELARDTDVYGMWGGLTRAERAALAPQSRRRYRDHLRAERETAIRGLLAEGFTRGEVAARLGLHPDTVGKIMSRAGAA